MSLRLDLKGKLLEEFNELLEYYGIVNATDLLRFLIKETHRRVIKKTQS